MPLLRAYYPFLIAIAALLVMPRSARAQILYIINSPGSGGPEVSEYHATTGALIKARFITGLSLPKNLALLAKSLFVTDSNTVSEYNAATGDVIKASFITGVSGADALAVSDQDNELFVSNVSGVGKYDAKTGAVMKCSPRLAPVVVSYSLTIPIVEVCEGNYVTYRCQKTILGSTRATATETGRNPAVKGEPEIGVSAPVVGLIV
jgi:hypothetical protein